MLAARRGTKEQGSFVAGALARGELVGGRYRLERELGRGGMSAVWAAEHRVTRREVALKFLAPAYARKPDIRRRFEREARAAASLAEHPHVVAVHDFFEIDDGTLVMVLDLLHGESLADRLRRKGKLSGAETAQLLLPVVSAVGAAHARGIVHRDLKPENVFVCMGAGGVEEVKVLDFGIAKVTELEADAVGEGVLTTTGALLGTPAYMAPEQVAGQRDIDQRADVWALGATMYQCLSAVRPVLADTVGQLLQRILEGAVQPLAEREPELAREHPELVALVGRMLARDRDARPRDLSEIYTALCELTPVRPPAFDAARIAPSEPGYAAWWQPSEAATPVVVDGDSDPEAGTAAANAPTRVEPRPATGGGRRRRLGAALAVVALGGVAVALAFAVRAPRPLETAATAAATTARGTDAPPHGAQGTAAAVSDTRVEHAEPTERAAPVATPSAVAASAAASSAHRRPATAAPSATGPAASAPPAQPHVPEGIIEAHPY
jgi:serine/threonine-protein kinase